MIHIFTTIFVKIITKMLLFDNWNVQQDLKSFKLIFYLKKKLLK